MVVRLFEKQIKVFLLGAAGKNHKCYYLDTDFSILSSSYFLWHQIARINPTQLRGEGSFHIRKTVQITFLISCCTSSHQE